MRKTFSLLLIAFIGVVACGGGEKGDSCDEEGRASGCDDGLVCAKERRDSGDLVCLKSCVGQEDCAESESCNGIPGSNPNVPGGAGKVCQPR